MAFKIIQIFIENIYKYMFILKLIELLINWILNNILVYTILFW
jgi:hypothetical protein